ncbi:MAG: STAS domain-containing protein [Planctomycetes bacterium]|nr:STAS domain-containing protein [Planctomycetota bacterium]
MKADLERRKGALVVRLAGVANSSAVDVEAALAPLAEAIRSAPPGMVVIDASSLTYIDTAAFATLERAIEPVRASGTVRFVGPGPGIARWFRLFEPRSDLSFYASIDDALVPGRVRRGGDDGWGAFWRCLRAPGKGLEDSKEAFVIDLEQEMLQLASEGFPQEEAFPPLTFDARKRLNLSSDEEPQLVRGPDPQVVCGADPQAAFDVEPEVAYGEEPQAAFDAEPEIAFAADPPPARDADPRVDCGADPQAVYGAWSESASRKGDDWTEFEALRASLAAQPLPMPSDAVDWEAVLDGDHPKHRAETVPPAPADPPPSRGRSSSGTDPMDDAATGEGGDDAVDRRAVRIPHRSADVRPAIGIAPPPEESIDDAEERGAIDDASREDVPAGASRTPEMRLERQLACALVRLDESEEARAEFERRLAIERRAAAVHRRDLEAAREQIGALEEALAEAKAATRPDAGEGRRSMPRTGPSIALAASLARRRAIDRLCGVAVRFGKALRLDCDAICGAVEDLARIVARAPHESYDPVARPAPEEMPGVQAANQTAMAMVLEAAKTRDPAEVRAAGLLAALDTFVRGSSLVGAGRTREQRLFDLARTEYFRPLWGDGRCPIRDPDDVRRRLAPIDAIARFLDEGLNKGAEPPLAVAALFAVDSPVLPEARRAFVDVFSLYPRGSWVQLSDGDVGVAIAPQHGLPECPVVVRLYRTEGGRLRSRAPSIAVPGRETWRVKVSRPVRDPLDAGHPRPALVV